MNEKNRSSLVQKPPKGIAILALIGPGLVWCSEMIGSGEVILTTRIGAILGTGIIWAIVMGIFLKYWIGMGGGRYTVCTGEGMIDMFDRIPGPRHWVVWTVLIIQFISGAIAIASVANAAGVFISSLFPIKPVLAGWMVSVFALLVVWSGGFRVLELIMSLFVLVIIIGILYVAGTVFPGFGTIFQGFLLRIPEVPQWAIEKAGIHENPWREILPLMGWAAGGFASQVWYSYWVMGAGYGLTRGRKYGVPADSQILKAVDKDEAGKIKGWCKVISVDATTAMLITTTVTLGFLIAGAGVLGSRQQAPEGPEIARVLSTLFSAKWGSLGGVLFRIAGAAALIGTQMAQMAGWPRLLADSCRICIPGFKRRFDWKKQYRIFLGFFFFSNIVLVYSLGFRPVFLVKMGAILDGLILTPLQALWVAAGLFIVMPRLFKPEIYRIIKPHWIFAVMLILGFLVFGYFCIFQIPYML